MTFTVLVIILTILSMYNIFYNEYFNNYHGFQISLFITLLIWSLEIIINKKGENYMVSAIIFIILANLIFIFMLWGVK
jgi:lipopolysaccharide export LptBFGC system permease protein LptF